MRPATCGSREPLAVLPDEPLVLATGGFGARLARERGLPPARGAVERRRRPAARPGAGRRGGGRSRGVLRPGVARAARAIGDGDFVRAAQLYGRFARVVDDAGRPVFAGEPSWSENDLVQAIARQPGGAAWYVVDAAALAERVRERTVEEMIGVAEELGGEVRREASGDVAVKVVAAVTHTLGGLRVDERARVLREDGSAIDGALRGRRGRRRDRDRRLRERPGDGARARPRGRGSDRRARARPGPAGARPPRSAP